MNGGPIERPAREAPAGPAAPYEPDLGSHLPALDSVRGLAILMVTAFRFHSEAEDLSAPGRAVFALLGQGHRGVDLFFVLSGFLITGILYDSKAGPHYFRTFYTRRTLRIFPLYYGVLFLLLVLLPAASTAAASLYQESIRHQAWLWLYGTNFLLAWKDQWFLHGLNPFWSLAVEEHFYLVWPLVIFLCTRRAAMLVCVACVVGAAGLRLWLVWLGGHGVALETLTPCRMDSLAVGGFLALAARGPAGVRALVIWAFAAATAGGLALAALWWSAGSTWSLGHSFFALLFGALIVAAVTADPGGLAGRLWNAPALQFCGKYSYGWYVFQGPLKPALAGLFTTDALAQWLGWPFLGRALYVVWGGGLSLALAVLSWHLYEKHFLKLKDVLAPKEGEDAPAAAGTAAGRNREPDSPCGGRRPEGDVRC